MLQALLGAADARLDELAARAGLLIVCILAAAGVACLLIGPLGLFMLRRVLQRIGAVGTALARLTRNDTSVEIPDLARADEIGEFARSVAVFKAKSLELLHKKAELERRNLQLDAPSTAGKLGMTTLAAAIASAPQCDWLRSHGCSEAQGYFFGPPVPAHSIEAALAHDAARQAA